MAQKTYILNRGPIIKNDSLKGYYFLNQNVEPHDKKMNDFQLELYNSSLSLSKKEGFLMDRGFEIVSVNIIENRVYMHFRDYHRGLNGEIKPKNVESTLLVYDIDQHKICKKIILPGMKRRFKGTSNETLLKDNFKFYYLSNKKILNATDDKKIKNKQVLQLLGANLDTLWNVWLNDDKFKFCTLEKPYEIGGKNIGLLVRKGNNERTEFNHETDFRIFSLDKGETIEKIQLYNAEEKTYLSINNTIYNEKTKEYFITGDYLTRVGKYSTESLGLFIIKINLSDISKPVITKKIYTWKNDFSNLGLNEYGYLSENNRLTVKKIIYTDEQISLVLNIDHKQIIRSVSAVLPPGRPYYSSFTKDETANLGNSEQYTHQAIPSPLETEGVNPAKFVKNIFCVLNFNKTLDNFKFSYIGGKEKDFTGLKFDESKHLLANMSIFYYKELGSINALVLFSSSNNKIIEKTTVASIVFESNNTCKTDQIVASDNATWTEYYPAKPGYIMIVEYFEKEKKLSQRIERFNY